jgi:DNA-binding response OmpR family regulator
MDAKILIVDDEAPIIEVLSYNLKQANYEVVIARDGEEALAQARKEQPDLILLDLMLPKLDGLDVCRILRKERDMPIIMLTARGTEIDRVVGLELGADDYIVKPFSVRELLVRVKNVLRRTTVIENDNLNNVVRVGELWIDIPRRESRIGVIDLELTALEFDLLTTLARYPGHVYSRERLMEEVWSYQYLGDLRAVDAAVKRLRAKLREAAPMVEMIQTIRGVGYKLVL